MSIRPATLQLGGSVEEPARARAFTAATLRGLGADVREDAVLLVSELVTNVVRHGTLPAHLRLDVDGASVRVVVHDSGTSLPMMPGAARADAVQAGSARASHGRGLIIVAALARSWGVVAAPTRQGKDVWFELGPEI